MKHRDHPHMRSALLACCLAAALPAAHAAETLTGTTTTTTSSATATTTVGTSATTETKLSTEFASFLGGETQARTVVSGLRQGTAFSLGTDPSTTGTPGTTIDPPTGTLGYGNVRIALRLAQAQLSEFGITQPTAEQLSAALLGGTINGTPVDGVLALRADGMGWGQIAHQYGTTVGQLMGKGTGLARPTPLPAQAAGKTTSASSSTGEAAPTSHSRSNGYIPSGKTTGSGFVTAMGGSVGGTEAGSGKGQAHKPAAGSHGAGTVSASGQSASLADVGNGSGGSKASAPGQIRKN